MRRERHRPLLDKYCARIYYTRGPGALGVGARCGNGLFPTYKSPKFYLSFTILVSFILVKYPASEYGTYDRQSLQLVCRGVMPLK